MLARVPTGRLLVLGGPGSGKTTLMLRLVLDLLERRQPGDRVPVLLPMSTWDPVSEGMPNWIARRLKDEYPFLVRRGPRGQQGSTSIWALITAGLILPILDGLDEMPDTVFGIAIRRVNEALVSGQGLVITSRTEAYRRAVHSASGMNVTLNATAGVELCPLDPEEVADYLASASGGWSAAARWAPVLTGLGTREPLRSVLATPLMVQLAKAIYTPRPDENISRVPDPAELLSPSMTKQTSIETHLLEGFIPAAYKASLGHSIRWTAEMAERWLKFLARYLELRGSGTNIAWWELNKAVPGLARAILSIVAGALVGGLAIGLPIGLVTGDTRGYLIGPALGVSIGLGLLTECQPRRGFRWRPQRAVIGGILAGLITGIATGFLVGAISAVATGSAFGVAFGVWNGNGTTRADLTTAASPQAVLNRDRSTTLTQGVTTALVFGVMIGLGGFRIGAFGGFQAAITFGAVGGLGVGLVSGLHRSSWAEWQIARLWLALNRQLPWRCMAFLDDAHNRGVLRQVGAVYEFRHVLLQRQLASGHRQKL